MSIRAVKKNDSNEINELSKELGYKQTSDAVSEKRIEVILASESDEIWVYEEDEVLIGWIHVFTANRVASASFIEIGGLVVSPKYRGNGIGKCLVEYVLDWANEKNLKVRVRCNSKRTEAHKFYQSIGFDSSKSQLVFEVTT